MKMITINQMPLIAAGATSHSHASLIAAPIFYVRGERQGRPNGRSQAGRKGRGER
ncbi:MAG: hypothetical protein ISP86_04315 [Shewanellaceae bacterium]|nr:hypothetical protein [Shewanellaceae bacterium]